MSVTGSMPAFSDSISPSSFPSYVIVHLNGVTTKFIHSDVNILFLHIFSVHFCLAKTFYLPQFWHMILSLIAKKLERSLLKDYLYFTYDIKYNADSLILYYI